ncbi:hypothetical protein [Streptomyces sp. NPDC059816]|uniref:hypothetical protein n=1 Tax=Streptomyces sp. NPDC059816 TaxID=3346960 RepID=UPI00365D6D92
MSDTTVLAGLSASLAALRVLAVDYGHLPAPDVQIGDLFPHRLELSFHGGDGLAAFEAWRQALDVHPYTVSAAPHSGGEGRMWALTATTRFAGAAVLLVGVGEREVTA